MDHSRARRWIAVFLTRFVFVAGLAIFFGCRGPEIKNQYQAPGGPHAPIVDGKYSLSADRQKLDELRKDVPAEVKVANDEEALLLQLFSDPHREPQKIRATFDENLRKKRDSFSADLKKEREAFSRQERKNREDFLTVQRTDREKFNASKPGKKAIPEFYKDQDLKRQDFFANEREKRNDFESQMRDKQKNFEDYVRGKQNDFNADMRAFQKRYEELKKEEAKH